MPQLDYEAIFSDVWDWCAKYGKYILLAIIVGTIAFGGYTYCGKDELQEAIETHEVKKATFEAKEKERIEAHKKLREARAKELGKVEVFEKDYKEKAEAVQEARKETDKALEKVEVIKESYKTGVTLEEAERNRQKYKEGLK